VIDLTWGAALTRFLSLSARQLGEDFISVGRVQGPTLKLIVDREREIKAFDPEAYWELYGNLTKSGGDPFEARYFYLNDEGNEAERVWNGDVAEVLTEAFDAADEAVVDDVRRRGPAPTTRRPRSTPRRSSAPQARSDTPRNARCRSLRTCTRLATSPTPD